MRNSHSIYTSTRNAIAILTLVIVNSCITNAQTFINKGFTQLSFDNATQEIHENIYNYNFAKADTLLHNYTVKTNKSTWSKLIYINYYWWQILTGNEKDKELRSKFNTNTNQIITNLSTGKNKLTPLSNENLYILANAYAFKTRLNLLEGEYLKGLLNLNKSIDYIQKCVGKEDVFEAFTIQTALLYYFVEYSQINKPITRPYLATMPAGSMVKGIALLQKGTKSTDAIIATECTYFLAKIYGEVEHNYNKSEGYCLTLTKKHPDNIAYQMNLYDCYINQNKHPEAQRILVAIHRLSKTLPNLTPAQRVCFINEAKKHSEAAYLKESKK